MQAPQPELAQPALLFQYSKHRFDDCFALGIDFSTRRVTQFLPHLAMRRVAQMFAPADPSRAAFAL